MSHILGGLPYSFRHARYELVPLSELKRPRIDVLASLSGIFRDSFANVVDLLDDLFETAAAAVRKRGRHKYTHATGIYRHKYMR